MSATVTITTATTLSSPAAASLTLIVVLTLLALLVQKELIGGLRGERAQQLRRALNIAIIPLTVVFITTVAVTVAQAL